MVLYHFVVETVYASHILQSSMLFINYRSARRQLTVQVSTLICILCNVIPIDQQQP